MLVTLFIPKDFYFFRDKSLMVKLMTEEIDIPKGFKLCECGCKTIVNNRFVQGHNRPFPKGKENPVYKRNWKGCIHPSWRGGRIITKKGYVKIYCPDHPIRGKYTYVFEHILIMEQKIGRFLTKREVVHHINEDTQDNRIENLKLFSNNSEHLLTEHKNKHG